MRRSNASGFRVRRLAILLVLTSVAWSGCKTETSPTFNGITNNLMYTVEGAGVTLEVAAVKPAAVATLKPTDTGSIQFIARCDKDVDPATRWGFMMVRDDNAESVFFTAYPCPNANSVPLQFDAAFTFRKSTTDYDFAHGHTVRLRMVVAASADLLTNGGPYLYTDTRDMATWTILD